MMALISCVAGSTLAAWLFWPRRGVLARDQARRTVERARIDDETVGTLAALEPGEVGEVVRIVPECQGAQRRRLLDLGVVPGTRIVVRFRSAAGDPVAYEIRGALIALRRDQAERILVRRVADTGVGFTEALEVRDARG